MQLSELKGIGPKTEKLLNELNIYNSKDLFEYYPYRYEILQRDNINLLNQNDHIVIDGIVENIPTINYFNRKMNKMEFIINIGTKIIKVTIFNRAFLKDNIVVGKKVTIIGRYDKLHNNIIASDIRLYGLSNIPLIEPIYHSSKGISSNQIRKIISNNINNIDSKNIIPDDLINKYKLLSREESIKLLHNSKDKNVLTKALSHLKYEELFVFMLKINYLKNKRNNILGLKRNVSKEKIQSFINNLPFALTEDQLLAINNILDDLNSKFIMNRLIQGDVGSGKTIVAIVALYINYLSGYQGVLMAPTEILAEQHYKNVKNIFKNYGIKIELLIGKLKVSEKKKIYKRLIEHDIDILIGTHALFSEEVLYDNLGLVITDEQHRFGVNQRSSLKNKGITPDILYLSATPIPRTYAITLYADMDISSIHTMPSGRKKVITLLKQENELKDILDLIFEQLKLRHQIYVVAPLIDDEDDNSEFENVITLKEKLEKAFGKHFKIGILHGKMSSLEKDDVMTRFKKNEINILVCTTVIEVGVDVENATVMCIWDSFKFGLSQLHQLRGRVGRNNLQSYCILVSDKEVDRLKVLVDTDDGFKVTEADFRIRGSGDLFGTRQSGDMLFKIANIKRDFNILLKAREDANCIIDSKLYVNSELYKYIEETIDIT